MRGWCKDVRACVHVRFVGDGSHRARRHQRVLLRTLNQGFAPPLFTRGGTVVASTKEATNGVQHAVH